MRVDQIMAQDVCTCRQNDSLEQAAQLMWNRDCGCLPVCTADEKAMSEAQTRRLPVLDAQDALVGLISLSDVAREAEREIAQRQPELSETEVGGTLAAICQPAANTLAA